MITNVYIIRPTNDMNKFFELDPETGNWKWTTNLEDATMFQSAEKATEIKTQKLPVGVNAYIYEIPYSVAQPQARKKKSNKKTIKRKSKKTQKKKRGK